MDKSTLDAIAERDTGLNGVGIAHGITLYCPTANVNTPLRLAHFLAQACHETGGFKWLNEIWGPTPAQKRYEFNLALGNTKPGDGRLYKGRGIFQLTGRANYTRIGAILSLPLAIQPDLAADPQIAVLIACNYWTGRAINVPADHDDIRAVTKLINGGENGLADRIACLNRSKKVLSC